MTQRAVMIYKGASLKMGQRVMVQGVVQSRDIFKHPFMICRLFGTGFYIRCLAKAIVHGKKFTFLDMLRMKESK